MTEPLLPLRLCLWKAAISSVFILRIFCCCSFFISSSCRGGRGEDTVTENHYYIFSQESRPQNVQAEAVETAFTFPRLEHHCVIISGTLTLWVLRCISVSRRRFCWLSWRRRRCNCSCCCLIDWTLRSSSNTRRSLCAGRLARRAVSLWRWLST